jgi:hypothetical protein
MIVGTVVSLGDIVVGGEELRGIFVECSKEELQAETKNILGKRVTVSSVKTTPACPSCDHREDVEVHWVCERCGHQWAKKEN